MDTIIPQRRCNNTFPATTDYFYADKTMKYGVGSCCRKCHYVRKPGVRQQINYYPRAATFEPVQLPLFVFSKYCYKCKTIKDINEFVPSSDRGDGYRSECKLCWNKKNREAYAKKDHTDETARKDAKRRNHKQTNALTEKVSYAKVAERDGMWCYICQKPIIENQRVEFDHVIPLARGGAHSESNIRITHRCCNRRKHDRLISEMTAFQRRGI